MHDSFDVILIEQSGLLREALSQMLGSAHLRVLASLPSYDRAVLTSVSSDGPLLLFLGAGRDFDATLRDVESFKQEHPAAKVALLEHLAGPFDTCTYSYCASCASQCSLKQKP